MDIVKVLCSAQCDQIIKYKIGDVYWLVQTLKTLTQFLAESSADPSTTGKLGKRTMFRTTQKKSFNLTSTKCEEVQTLKSSQEEVDTRLLLHAQHAAVKYKSAVLVSDESCFSNLP